MTPNAKVLIAVAAALTVSGSLTTTASASASTAPIASKSFAGYEVTKTKTHVSSVTTTFAVPSITCKKSFSGVGPSIVVQTTPNKKNVYAIDAAAVGVGCVKGKAEYESIIEVNNDSFNDFPFSAGDSVKVTITLNKKKTSVTVDDLTSKTSKTRTGAGRLGEYAYLGDEGLEINSKKTGLDPFTKTSFTASKVNGKSLSAQKAVAYEAKRGKTLLIAVSRLSKGEDFDLTFEHS